MSNADVITRTAAKRTTHKAGTIAAAIAVVLAGAPELRAAETGNPAVDIVATFEKIWGVTNGKRRNHTKGFCFEATFAPVEGEIQAVTSSSLFGGESSVIGRFSHAGGDNNAPDNKLNGQGMALSITTPSGAPHMMAMSELDFFFVSTPEALAEMFVAISEGPEAVERFTAGNEEYQAHLAHAKTLDTVIVPYEGRTFNSVNSFYLVDTDGNKTAARWSFVPTRQHSIVVEQTPDFFFDNIQKNLQDNEIAWDMHVTLANEGDDVNNAAKAWQGEHKRIHAATLTITAVMTEEEGSCDTINFDPLILSPGFEPSDDPILQARRTAYAVSFGRRMSEKTPR